MGSRSGMGLQCLGPQNEELERLAELFTWTTLLQVLVEEKAHQALPALRCECFMYPMPCCPYCNAHSVAAALEQVQGTS